MCTHFFCPKGNTFSIIVFQGEQRGTCKHKHPTANKVKHPNHYHITLIYSKWVSRGGLKNNNSNLRREIFLRNQKIDDSEFDFVHSSIEIISKEVGFNLLWISYFVINFHRFRQKQKLWKLLSQVGLDISWKHSSLVKINFLLRITKFETVLNIYWIFIFSFPCVSGSSHDFSSSFYLARDLKPRFFSVK